MTEDNSGMTAAPHGGSPAAASRSREVEMLPCPFCGGERLHCEHGDFDSTYVFCNDCGAHGPNDIAAWSGLEPEEYEREARRLWNERPRLQPAAAAGREDAIDYVLKLFADKADWVEENYHEGDVTDGHGVVVSLGDLRLAREIRSRLQPAAAASREDGIEECAKWHEAQFEKCAEHAKEFLDHGDIVSNGHQADEAQFHMHCAVSLRMLLSRLQPAAAAEAPSSAERVTNQSLTPREGG